MSAEAHVNTCYKHFYYFVTEFDLVAEKEFEPLVSIYFVLCIVYCLLCKYYCLEYVYIYICVCVQEGSNSNVSFGLYSLLQSELTYRLCMSKEREGGSGGFDSSLGRNRQS